MRLGVHIRIARGLLPALETARDIGCETVQFFASNPNAWRFGETDPVEAGAFVQRCSELGIRPVTLHTAYLLNLASPDDEIWGKSTTSLTLSLKRADMLGAAYVVTHIGSHGGAGYANGVARIRRAVRAAVEDSGSKAMVLLESGSGAGNSVGSKFEELSDILQGLSNISERVGICLDSAHLYGSGYDISTAQGVDEVISHFDATVGIDRLKFVHLNDTQKALGSKIDRHWHIGEGNVGTEGFRALINHPLLVNIAGVVETPGELLTEDQKNLNRLKELREVGLAAD